MQETLISSAKERGTVLCFGVDPDHERIRKAIPAGSEIEDTLGPFFHDIIDKLLEENAIAALKPNYAYFAQYGFDGLFVLEELIQHYKAEVPVILDGKRGDIGKSSKAYAREAYDFWGADAVTISPYMGEDSVRPFLRDGKLAYMLCRTSNPGAKDFEELESGGKQIFEHVAEKALEWQTGLVVGATSDAISKIAKTTQGKVPFLIPGIGAQGGDLEMVMEAIKESVHIHRINTSSSIAYAFEKSGKGAADAALEEAEKLNSVIKKYL